MKNKEIEELKDVAERHTIEIREYGVVETIPQSISKELRLNSYSANLLLSYIEQLENNRDKAIEIIKKDWYKLNSRNIDEISDTKTDIIITLYNILKGDSE